MDLVRALSALKADREGRRGGEVFQKCARQPIVELAIERVLAGRRTNLEGRAGPKLKPEIQGAAGSDKATPLNRHSPDYSNASRIRVRPTTRLGIQPWRGMLVARRSTYWSRTLPELRGRFIFATLTVAGNRGALVNKSIGGGSICNMIVLLLRKIESVL